MQVDLFYVVVFNVNTVIAACPTWCLVLLLSGPPGRGGCSREVAQSLCAVRGPTVGCESLLRSEQTHVFAPVGAVEQVAADPIPAPLHVLLHHRQRAVRFPAAGVQTVPPAVQGLRSQQEGGPQLDGVSGPDDTLPDGVVVAQAGVDSRILSASELLTELLQQLLHPGDLRFQIRDGRGAGDRKAEKTKRENGGEHPQKKGHDDDDGDERSLWLWMKILRRIKIVLHEQQPPLCLRSKTIYILML